MNLKKWLKILFHLFCALTTFILLFVAFQGTFLNREISFSGIDLFKLVSISFVSVLPSFIYLGQENASHKKIIFLRSLHFILTAGAVFGCLILYGWIDSSTAIASILFFLITYITASVIIEIRDRKLANKLNEKINEFHNAENETHHD
jgi:hypothetical protein